MSGIEEKDWFIPPVKYEYLDHTADVQVHSWGDTLKEAFEQCANGMFGCITDLAYVEMKETLDIEASGDDINSLLFHFLDEFLYNFSAEPNFIPKKVEILEFDIGNFAIKARGFGETFEIGKHPQCSDVKAITYGSMQVLENEDKAEIFVILDI